MSREPDLETSVASEMFCSRKGVENSCVFSFLSVETDWSSFLPSHNQNGTSRKGQRSIAVVPDMAHPARRHAAPRPRLACLFVFIAAAACELDELVEDFKWPTAAFLRMRSVLSSIHEQTFCLPV